MSRRRWAVCAGLVLLSAQACDEPVGPAPEPALRITSLSPAEIVAGELPFTLTVEGAGFAGSVVHWNGQPRPTEFVSDGRLRAAIGAADVATVGDAAVTVVDLASRRASSPAAFRVRALVVDPARAAAGSIQAGTVLSCGVAQSGAAHCWGENRWGHLGNGERFGPPALEPARVDAAVSFRQLAIGTTVDSGTGSRTVCGLTGDGRAFCWGDNINGATGVDPYTESQIARPTELPTPLRFTRVAAGDGQVCGLSGDGQAHCWGDGASGQLGDARFGTGGPDGRHWSAVPLRVPWAEPFRALAAGEAHGCALTTSGKAICWGRADVLGIGRARTVPNSAANVLGPTPVSTDQTFAAIDAGYELTCALTSAGAAWCWGGFGLVGPRALLPTRLEGAPPFTAISIGYEHACGIAADGRALCWGSNEWGQLGSGALGGQSATPTLAAGGRRFATIDAGVQHTCGVTVDGVGLCWGRRGFGRLGSRTATDLRLVPTRTAGGHSFAQLAGRCGRTADGALYCWGPQQPGPGIDTGAPREPTRVPGEPLTTIAGSHTRVCGLTAAGAAWCLTPLRTSMLPVTADVALTSLVGGTSHCGLTAAGAAHCWGTDMVASAVSGGHVFRSLAAGAAHFCGLDAAGATWCWGSNVNGQLGPGGNEICPRSQRDGGPYRCSTVPVRAASGHTFTRLEATGQVSCGITAEGVRLCWGALPSATAACSGQAPWLRCSETPMVEPAWADFRTVVLASQSCGLVAGGAARCWGSNDYGELGIGRIGAVATPEPVLGGLSFTALDLSLFTTCGLTGAGEAWCWGLGSGGEIGDGAPAGEVAPVTVAGVTFALPPS